MGDKYPIHLYQKETVITLKDNDVAFVLRDFTLLEGVLPKREVYPGIVMALIVLCRKCIEDEEFTKQVLAEIEPLVQLYLSGGTIN